MKKSGARYRMMYDRPILNLARLLVPVHRLAFVIRGRTAKVLMKRLDKHLVTLEARLQRHLQNG